MELMKKNIHMNRQKNRAVSQLTLDDDYNVPDTRVDIGKIIQEKGNIKIEEMKPQAEHVVVRGALEFQILYLGDQEDKQVHSLDGSIPFEEIIHISDVADGDNLQLKWSLDDMNASMIHSRKVSVKTIVTFYLFVEELYEQETAVEVHGEPGVDYRNKGLDVLQMVMNKKDTFRIKEEINLPSNKPNIFEVLWDSVQLRAVELRLMEEKISLKGELSVFVLYASEGEEPGPQWMETAIPFDGVIDCPECTAEMYSDIDVSMSHVELAVKPDYDGEERSIGVDVVLELNMKVYGEDHVDMLEDVYCATRQLIPVRENVDYETLLVKNSSKCRTSDRIRIGNGESRILQLLHNEAQVKVDVTEVVDDGIEVDGAVEIKMLYVTSDDSMPFHAIKGMIPFHYVIEVPGITKDCTYNLKSDIEQISATMIDSEEVEVKATINLNVLVLKRMTEQVVTDVKEEPLDMEMVQNLPGIVGYIVHQGDSLWNIAKKYYTTVENIIETNELPSENVKPGDRLIIVKTVESLF